MPGTFVYTPAAGTVLKAGAAQTLSVTFTPTDAANYTDGDRDVAITVLKATPTITWPTPADITYGTALERDAAERDGECAGHLRLHAGRGHGADRGRGADAVGDLHADRPANYTDGDGDVPITVAQGDADDHLADARRTSPTARRSSATQLNATATCRARSSTRRRRARC